MDVILSVVYLQKLKFFMKKLKKKKEEIVFSFFITSKCDLIISNEEPNMIEIRTEDFKKLRS